MSSRKVPRTTDPPGVPVRDARLRARGRGTLLRLAVLLVVVAVAGILLYRTLRTEHPPFRIDNAIASSSDGEGLMGTRRLLRQELFEPRAQADGPYIAALRGPGSTVLGYVELTLDRDASAMRIRQRGTRIDENVSNLGTEPTLRWHGWVAHQPADFGRGERLQALPWRNAGGERGVLVRPGETVRLRTRYDVPRSTARVCTTEIRGGGDEWEVLEDGDDVGGTAGSSLNGEWEPLRARSERQEGEDVTVLTGQLDRIAYRIGRPGCRDGGSSGDSGAIDGG